MGGAGWNSKEEKTEKYSSLSHILYEPVVLLLLGGFTQSFTIVKVID